ncbi:IPT/TIG domain-containing protein [Actinoplanes sp. GCM10030250]|uniref:IPT/TIG domain-containing protein n=1 Tax=Actinoplanes sp. GCM10030250 TaxID=3273376 RepID=UPI003618891C
MAKSSRARRATALAATTAVVLGSVGASVVQPSAAFSAAQSRVALTALAAPKIASLTPALGDVQGGTVVQIAGTNLKSTTAVMFGDAPATRVVVLSDTRVIAVAPPGSAGNTQITVTTGSGTVMSRFGYRQSLGAEFFSVSADARGGTPITVAVTGGTVGETVAEFRTMRITAQVGGAAATVAYVDSTHVRITAPPVTRSGSVTLQLVHDGFAGTMSTSTVDYIPAVTAVTAARASTEGGDTVKITGAGFLGVDEDDPEAVTFGGVPALTVGVVSGTQIFAEVPPGSSGLADVRVTAPDGRVSAESPNAQIRYRAPLAVDDSGDLALRGGGGATVLTVTGGTLGDDAKAFAAEAVSVLVGRQRLLASYVDRTHLRVMLPPLTADSVDVQLVHDTVVGPVTTLSVVPAVMALSAVTDSVAGGRKISVRVAGPRAVTGTGFMFGENPATCEKQGTASSLVFICTVPPASQAGPVWVSFTSGSGVPSRFTSAATFSYTDLD